MSGKRTSHRFYRGRPSIAHRIGSVMLMLIIFFFSYLLVSTLFLQSISVSSVSMEPIFTSGDRLFFSPLAYGPTIPFTSSKLRGVRTPGRGSLVIVRPPYFRTTPLRRIVAPVVSFFTLQRVQLLPKEQLPFEQSMLIRRVVGVPGDTIRLDHFVAQIRPKGAEHFQEEYALSSSRYAITFNPGPKQWEADLPASGNSGEITLKAGEFFLLSDNRSMANDSRSWGPLTTSNFLGRVLFRYWPFSSIGVPR